MSQNNFFPSIGAVAEKADNTEEAAQETPDKDADVTPAQEVESLCMKCGEQVRFVVIVFTAGMAYSFGGLPVGCHSYATYIDSVLPRGHRDVVSMRALRGDEQ